MNILEGIVRFRQYEEELRYQPVLYGTALADQYYVELSAYRCLFSMSFFMLLFSEY